MTTIASVLLILFTVGACGGSDDPAKGHDGGPVDSGDVDSAVARSDAHPPCATADGPIIYLNGAGGTYRAGTVDESRTNTTTATHITADERTLGPWPYDDANWAEIVACVKGALSPFDVQVVEADPGDVPHHEIVFADLNITETLSAAPRECGMVLESPLSFVFGAAAGDDAGLACRAAMTNVGFVVGLDFARRCEDYMSYVCYDDLEWVDEDVSCGRYAVEPCCTGLPTQNSYQTLLAAFGACQ
jgi:hypothetical protein